MNAGNVKKRKSFSREFVDFISKWLNDIFNCSCKDSPYCDCGKLNLEKMILNSRVKHQLTIEEICRTFEDEYKIKIFKGDVIDYLENLIYSLESIKNILEGTSHLDPMYLAELQEIPKIVSKIKY